MENKNASPVSDDLLTNKSNAALLRDSELELVTAKTPPVDLRTVPIGEWDKHISHDVTLPESVTDYFDERHEQSLPLCNYIPLSEKEVHAIEKAVEEYHGVEPPFYIYMSLTLQQTGRPWAYVSEAGEYLTGLTLGKNPNSAFRIPHSL